ncbi:uv-damaged DNA-binding protein [Purpureocillium lavendulum]|uniref:Uv-damaged DNA-binding protein n=1 Tax=Purpureocillium lavendulum TaxID=1247861 RepID=A0AB34G6Z3_9HYPO|nr:uv-damaged DNA-binding protein [Purpureocillium lavendulum]
MRARPAPIAPSSSSPPKAKPLNASSPMAIYSAVPPPEELVSNVAASGQLPPPPHHAPSTPVTNGAIDIDAWTVQALQSLSISPVARGTGTPLAINIDDRKVTVQADARAVDFKSKTPDVPRRPPSARDSQRKRDAVLRGKEGSRQRRRWENDRLIGVPNVQPPLPSDWEVRPAHPVRRVPYQLAQFWDRGVRQRVEDKTSALQAARKKQQRNAGSATGLAVGEVPRDLRESAKRNPVIRNWVRSLEDPVRQYLVDEQRHQEGSAKQPDDIETEDLDSEDEEIVFVGRKSAMRELKEKREARHRMARREVEHETVDSGVLFDSFGEGDNAAFKRWLTHTISDYYGLASRSIVMPNACKVVYVGLHQTHQRAKPPLGKLPVPLWQLC